MKTEVIKITEQECKMFQFLNGLRKSGVTNMFGASPYLVNRFDVNKNEASKVLAKWMDNFNEDGYTHLL